MKIALPFIENSLALLFNTSIETSKFPVLWKIARVTPIYKEGERTDKSNYRPISVLPVISSSGGWWDFLLGGQGCENWVWSIKIVGATP